MTRMPVLKRVPQELYLVAAFALAPFALEFVGVTPHMLSRIIIWGIFGLGFHLLFGVTGLLSFGQTIFYGIGGFVTAYLLRSGYIPDLYLALLVGTACAVVVGFVVGALSVQRSGIYFAMVTFAFAEFAYFLEFSPLRQWTGGEDGLAGVPRPAFLNDPLTMYAALAGLFVVAYASARYVKESSFGLLLRAIKRNNQRTAALGHNVWLYRVGVFSVASVYAGFAGGLLGVFQTYMPPDAFASHTSVQLVVQTVIGGLGFLVGPLIGAFVWIYLRTVLQLIPEIGALWQLLLALVFVSCVLFLPQGIVGAVRDLVTRRRPRERCIDDVEPTQPETHPQAHGPPAVDATAVAAGWSSAPVRKSGETVLSVRNLSKRYGGLVAVNDVSFDVADGGIVAMIGPNGAGKSTLFSMLSGGLKPTRGSIQFKGRNIAGIGSTKACQLGVSKSYQVVQVFHDMSVRDNVTIAVLARRYGAASLRALLERPGATAVQDRVNAVLADVGLATVAEFSVDELPYGERRRLEIGLALAGDPDLLLLDEPLAGLSPSERGDIKSLVRHIATETNVLIVEHDVDAVYELAERVIVLHRGEILFDGAPEEMRGDEAVRNAYLGRRVLIGPAVDKARSSAS